VVYTTGCKADDPEGGSCALLCPDPDGTAIASALAQCSASVVVTGTVTSNELGLADARCAKRLSFSLSQSFSWDSCDIDQDRAQTNCHT
jgi:hypothetical protein